MSLYEKVRPLLFRLDPERAHRLTLGAIATAGRVPALRWLLRSRFEAVDAPVDVLGMRFRNRVGLAAGFDKNAVAYRGLSELGFGHLELGTVTPEPQPGRGRPRVFRLPDERAVINRLGFPSDGADRVAGRLVRARSWLGRRGVRLGINIGKQATTDLADAPVEYAALAERFAPLADFLTINVSSPNTRSLRALQERSALEGLLDAVVRSRDLVSARLGRRVPLLVKLAPDLDEHELAASLEAVIGRADGIVATNTTVSRPVASRDAAEPGGLSGRPLADLSFRMLQRIVRLTEGTVPVVSVGGIDSPDEAAKRLDAGASLVQLYTGMIFDGPGLVARVAHALAGSLGHPVAPTNQPPHLVARPT